MKDTDSSIEPIETFSGIVAHGDKLGRTLGFPTANLNLDGPAQSSSGVYISAVRIGHAEGLNQVHFGLSSLGCRPTVSGQDLRLETFIPDFSGDLYDQWIDVVLLKFVRCEEKFGSLEELVDAMNADLNAFRACHKSALRDLLPKNFFVNEVLSEMLIRQ